MEEKLIKWRQKEAFWRAMGVFCILASVVVTGLSAFVKTHKTVHQKVSIYYILYLFRPFVVCLN